MRFSSFQYLIREGFRNLWHNRFMAAASIGVLVSCLLMTGGAYLTFVNIDHIFGHIQQQNVAVAFVDDSLDDDGTAALQTEIQAIHNVLGVEFRSKDESLADLGDDLPVALFESLEGENNPLQHSFVVTFADQAQLEASVGQLKALPGIASVSYNSELSSTLTNINNVVMTIGGWIIAVLLLVSLFIISNTIKLTVYSRRLEIYIMKSVGATDAFIRFPFAVEGMVIGLLSGGTAYGILYYLYSKLTENFRFGPMLKLVDFSQEYLWLIMLVGFLAVGLLTGMLGSVISMSRYLKTEGSEQL